jgi:hypothetical protein
MALTTFSGPVKSDNGFIGAFTGGTTNLALTGTLSVDGASTLTGAVTATAGVNGPVGAGTPSTGAFTTLAASGDATLSGTANVIIVPTVDPGVPGALWNDAGTLKVSV